MYAVATLTSLALLFAARVHAAVYVTQPVASSQCTGGQTCPVSWVDDGQSPLLSQIGECNVAIYTGEYQLVQSLPSVDVSTTSSFSFTPDPAAGPNGQYYIVFSSTSITYTSFSASFGLSGMTGTTPSGSSTTPTATSSTGSSSSSSTSGSSSSSGSLSTPSGTSTSSGTSSSGTGSSTPTVSSTGTSSSASGSTSSTPTSTTTSHTSSSSTTSGTPTSSTSATPSNAAVRVGSSASLGGMVAFLVLSGVLAF